MCRAFPAMPQACAEGFAAVGGGQVREKEDRFQQRKINSFFGVRQALEEPAAARTGADVDMEARPVCRAHRYYVP